MTIFDEEDNADQSIFNLFDTGEYNSETCAGLLALTMDNGGTHEEDDNESDVPPTFLMKAILAGLYELPPMHILKFQNGWGRRIKYDDVVRLEENFKFCSSIGFANVRTHISRMELTRKYFADKVNSVADFPIYRLMPTNPSMIRDLFSLALQQERTTKGLDVSNAGGSWHGPPNLLTSCQSTPAVMHLHDIIVSCITKIDDRSNALDLSAGGIECWFNISRHGSWNRLHTHEGSLWSGVLYVFAPEQKYQYNGSLVIKPSPHPRECSYRFSNEERYHFSNWRERETKHVSENICEYLDLSPKEGMMIIFPSWLHHCVLPSITESSTDKPRISIAFNISPKPK